MIDGEKPLVTIALFAYNQEAYINDAVDGVLAQDYENLEIILSDDCSSDKTFESIEKRVLLYSGENRLILNRNSQNLGIADHVSKIFKMANGEIVVVAAGDDVSYDYRVSDVVKSFVENKGISCVSFIDDRIDENGNLTKINRTPRQPTEKGTIVSLGAFIKGSKISLSGASRAYKKNVFNIFGELNKSCPTEDSTLLLRSLMLGDALVLPHSGIKYRRHRDNISEWSSLMCMNFEALCTQYKKDVALAAQSGLICDAEFKSISKFIDQNYKNRVLSRKVQSNSGVKKFYCLLGLILNSTFSSKVKLNYLFRYIKDLID